MSKITHKGISMLLKHHGLDENCSDDDIKNCVNAAIENSDEPVPEEEGGENLNAEPGAETVTNRDKEIENHPVVKALKAQVAELVKNKNATGATLHNRNTARTPEVNVDEIGASEAEQEGQAIANRAAELQKLHPGMSMAHAFKNAATEVEKAKAGK